MNEMDKNMEEFFRKSMERFDDIPSDNVWDQLSDQLDHEETFFTRLVRGVRRFLPLAILLLSFAGMAIFSLQTINELKSTNNKLQSENLNYQESLSILNEEKSTLNNNIVKLETEIKNLRKQNNIFENQIKESKRGINEAIKKNGSILKRLELSEALSSNYKFQLDACANDIINGSAVKDKDNAIAIERRDQSVQIRPISLLESEKVLNLISLDERNPLEKFGSLDPNENLLFKDLTKDPQGSRKVQYRYGLTGRAYNTFVRDGINFNVSNSYGLKHELTYNNQWSLTHSLEYNEQEYSVRTEAGGLPDDVLSRYPDNPGDYASVREVKSRSKYFDTQVGLKYQWPNRRGKSYYFINPSVVCQLYLPQEFNYDLIQAQDLLVERREYVGYIGSVNLQLGMERALTDKIDIQLSVFAERSLIELGYDDQTLTLVGLRSSILFGK